MAYIEQQSCCCSGLINTLCLPMCSFASLFHVHFVFPYDKVILFPPKFPLEVFFLLCHSSSFILSLNFATLLFDPHMHYFRWGFPNHVAMQIKLVLELESKVKDLVNHNEKESTVWVKKPFSSQHNTKPEEKGSDSWGATEFLCLGGKGVMWKSVSGHSESFSWPLLRNVKLSYSWYNLCIFNKIVL